MFLPVLYHHSNLKVLMGRSGRQDNKEILVLVPGVQLEAGRMSGMLSNGALIKLGMVTCML